jgi:hypothetical protein
MLRQVRIYCGFIGYFDIADTRKHGDHVILHYSKQITPQRILL